MSASQRADVLIITALPEEYKEALKVEDGAMGSWAESRIAERTVAFRYFKTTSSSLRVALTWSTRMRTIATAEVASRLLETIKPRCLAMSGVCAGRRGKVYPGDVIVGSTLYRYDTGALTVEYDEANKKYDRFKADPDSFPLDEEWLHLAQNFQLPKLPPRPPTLEAQGNWILERLHAGDDPVQHSGRATHCGAWGAALNRLRRLHFVTKRSPLALTAAGRRYMDDLRLLHPDGLPAEPPPRLRVAPIATGDNVMRDSRLFERLSDTMREVLAVEMEAHAIAAIAHARPLRWLVMKAVMDHADHDKDDQVKAFAARASAECLIAFLRQHLPASCEPPSMGTDGPGQSTAAGRVGGPHLVAVGRLPRSDRLLVGRKGPLGQLDGAWDGLMRRRVITIVAMGGTGKTALINHWNADLAQEGYRGARRVLGWSFYSQGTSEDRGSSADEFVDWALRLLGDPLPSKGSPFDRAERLARLLRTERTLLFLDGVEPLQYPPGPEEGRFKDRAIGVLLRDLCADNPGLCVVTTRLPLADIEDHEGTAAETVDLTQLDEASGAELLRALGVVGTEDERREAAHEFGGHALALTLLGQYLQHACGGDVQCWRDVGPLEDQTERGGHARRVMRSYERWFQQGPERDILHLLGLFDRPARAGALEALRAAPAIPGLTDHLVGVRGDAWMQALARLRRARLVEDTDPQEHGTVDAHALVREHFNEVLRSEAPAAWKEGHRRLYQYYRGVTKDLPATLQEMAPLYAAVTHACHAGIYKEALSEVYYRRICRERLYYSTRVLGAFSADLGALANFFGEIWRRPLAYLDEPDQSFLLHQVGHSLRAVGRLREAAECLAAALDRAIAQRDWQNAPIGASNLSGLYLALGEISRAIEYAQQAIEFAERRPSDPSRGTRRTDLATALFQAGRIEEAMLQFRKAEATHAELQPKYPILYALAGYQYNDLLLTCGAIDDARLRAERTLPWTKEEHWLLDTALTHLSLGQVYLALAREADADCRDIASGYLTQAVAGLRQASAREFLTLGLLARAEFFLFYKSPISARADLDEAMAIASRSSMRLHEADAHLGFTRLYLTVGDRAEAHRHLELARALITCCGYGRRKSELDALNTQIAASVS